MAGTTDRSECKEFEFAERTVVRRAVSVTADRLGVHTGCSRLTSWLHR
jgi:hypothetical protein